MITWVVAAVIIAVVGYFLFSIFGSSKPKDNTQNVSSKKEDTAATEDKKTIRRATVDPSAMQYGPVTVYFASQTGTAEQFANDIAEEGKEKSVFFQPKNLKDLDFEELKKETMAIFVIATHYEGEPPDDAVPIWEKINALADPTMLSQLKYTGFALGDLTYKHYCGFGKNINRKLTELGATSIHEFGTGSNDQNKIETFFLKWKEGIWNDVLANVPANPNFGQGSPTHGLRDASSKSDAKFIVTVEDRQTETPLDSITNYDAYDVNCSKYLKAFNAKVIQVRELRQLPKETESTLHMEIELPSGKQYKTACNIVIFPENNPTNVQKALDCVGLKDGQVIRVQPGPSKPKLPCPEYITVGNFFRSFVDLQGSLKKSALKALSKVTSNATASAELERLASKDGEREFQELVEKNFGIIDVITNFGIKLDIVDFVAISTRILPRYYTVSSSNQMSPNVLSITASIDYVEVGTERKIGLASQFFQRTQKAFESGSREKLFMRIDILDSCFHLPAKPKTDCIFISTGAGIAPFIGMLQEKEFIGEKSENPFGNVDMFFGCRMSNEDYIYKKDIMRHRGSGIIRECFEAFSREDPHHKVYVQHLLEQQKQFIIDTLYTHHGTIYICGNIGMSKAIENVIKAAFRELKGLSEEKADKEFFDLQDKRQICVEAWG